MTAPSSGKKVRKSPAPASVKTDNKSIDSADKKISWVWPGVALIVALLGGAATSPSLQGKLDFWKKEKNLIVETEVSAEAFDPFALCDQDALAHFLHKDSVRGLHVACVKENEDRGSWNLDLFPGAQQREHPHSVRVNPSDGRDRVLWTDLKQHLTSELSLRPTDSLHQPWAVFTPIGERIVAEDEHLSDEQAGGRVADHILGSGMILIFQGGQFLWPGVRIGYKRQIDLYSIMPGHLPKNYVPRETRNATLETLSLRPLVLAVNGFLSSSECEHIQERALPTMSYSGVVLMDKDKDRPASDFRTSQSTFLSANDDILRDIDYRTASLVRIPRNHQETVQVLRYGLAEKYDGHHDFFNPALYRNDPGTLRLIQNGRRNRIATVFWYLSDVEEGGETFFPRFNGAPQPRNLAECGTAGLKVKPQTGKVIIFYSLTPQGDRDELSLHNACPVKKGIKFAANKWVWNAPMPYVGV